MAYALKTSGLPTSLVACLGVDQDGTTVRDFVTNRAGTYSGSAGGTGSKNWKGTPRAYFNTAANGGHDYFGWVWTTAAGAALPPVDYTAGGLAVYMAIAFRTSIGDDGPMFDTTAQNGANIMSGPVKNQWDTSFTARLVGATNVPAAATSYSIGGYYLIASAATDIMFGLESGSIASDASASPGAFGSASQTLAMYGGSSGGGFFNGGTHIAAFFNRDLTGPEWDSLHADWFGTLFQSQAGAPNQGQGMGISPSVAAAF